MAEKPVREQGNNDQAGSSDKQGQEKGRGENKHLLRSLTGKNTWSGTAKEQYESEVRETVHRVQHLIRYAAESGIEIDPDEQLVLAEFSRKVIEGEDWTTTEEAGFWQALCTLSKKLAPVTFMTLESSGAKAKKYVWFFGSLTLILLALLVYAQFAWVVLNNVTETIAVRYSEYNSAKLKLEELDIQRKALEIKLESAKQVTGQTDAQQDQQREQVSTLEESLQLNQGLTKENELKMTDSEDQLASSMRILIGWLPFQGWLKTTRPPEPKFWDSEAEEVAKLQNIEEWERTHPAESMYRNKALHTWAVQILQGMSAYILPMIYGLVGACAFVLRSMSRQIRELTFSMADSTVQYMLRLVLGALAGISIGWFLKPDASSANLVSSISPLAIAFVAGYSVELLFTAMDKVIVAFTGRGPGQPKASVSD